MEDGDDVRDGVSYVQGYFHWESSSRVLPRHDGWTIWKCAEARWAVDSTTASVDAKNFMVMDR